mgnify:CR=1 FL=1
MIIGLSGFAKSGKDEIANMIQNLTTENNTTPWVVKRYAGKLKEIASLLTGIHPDLFEQQDIKESQLGDEWSVWGYKGRNEGDGVNPKFTGDPYRRNMTVREFLQKLGTEAVRDNLHENAWVNALMADYKPNYKWVITDVRFLNEAHAIKERDGIVVRVNRTGIGPVNGHSSETSLNRWDFDYIIENNGSLEDLRNTVKILLDKI